MQLTPQADDVDAGASKPVWSAEAAASAAPFDRHEQRFVEMRPHMVEMNQLFLEGMGVGDDEYGTAALPKQVSVNVSLRIDILRLMPAMHMMEVKHAQYRADHSQAGACSTA